MEADLEAEYARMAQNEERETNALAWSEGLISDGTIDFACPKPDTGCPHADGGGG